MAYIIIDVNNFRIVMIWQFDVESRYLGILFILLLRFTSMSCVHHEFIRIICVAPISHCCCWCLTNEDSSEPISLCRLFQLELINKHCEKSYPKEKFQFIVNTNWSVWKFSRNFFGFFVFVFFCFGCISHRCESLVE